MENIEQRVKKIVAEQLGVNEADVKNESSFVNDLGADSLALGGLEHQARVLLVEGDRLGEVGVRGEMVDQVEQVAPPTPPPEVPELDARVLGGEVGLERLAVSADQIREAAAFPCLPSP